MKHSLAGKVSAKAAACLPGSIFFSGKGGGAEDNGDGQKALLAGDPSIEIVEALNVDMIDTMIVVMINQGERNLILFSAVFTLIRCHCMMEFTPCPGISFHSIT